MCKFYKFYICAVVGIIIDYYSGMTSFELIKCDYVEVKLQVFFKCWHSLPVTGQLPNWTHFPQDKRYQYP